MRDKETRGYNKKHTIGEKRKGEERRLKEIRGQERKGEGRRPETKG